jgi:hypothetical protein
VDDAPTVHVLQGKTNLNKPVENLQFRKVLFFGFFALDVVSQVTD